MALVRGDVGNNGQEHFIQYNSIFLGLGLNAEVPDRSINAAGVELWNLWKCIGLWNVWWLLVLVHLNPDSPLIDPNKITDKNWETDQKKRPVMQRQIFRLLLGFTIRWWMVAIVKAILFADT